MNKKFLLFFIFLFLPIHAVIAHGGEEEFMLDNSQLYPITQLQAAGYGLLAFGALIIIILIFRKKMSDTAKKIFYSIIVCAVSIVTIYLIVTTIHLNTISATKGPVHWHADFEIWVCGEEIYLTEPKGFSNKQGVDLMHAHTDNRVHVEGVLLDENAASLGAFFYAVGGSVSKDGMKVPTDDGLISVHDGDKCNEKPGKLYVFVNGQLNDDPAHYIISPYEKVPPGDRIKFIFTDKPVQELDTSIKSK